MPTSKKIRGQVKEIFLADIASHQMTVLHSDGLYRHIRFKQPEHGWSMWFDLVTWPGNLTICGDMGTWTFARLDDMFQFFRPSGGLVVNQSYWAEKLQNGTSGGRENAKEWSEETFTCQILDQLENRYAFEGEVLKSITQAVRDEILSQETKYEIMLAARDFTYEYEVDGDYEDVKHKRKFQFDTCELPSGKDYSYHFTWCCYAIVWGIQQWDAIQTPKDGVAV